MTSIIRFRKLYFVESVKCSSLGYESFEKPKSNENQSFNEAPKAAKKEEKSPISPIDQVIEKPKVKKSKRLQPKEWRCIDNCCWIIGYICTTWWLLLFLFNCLPANLPGLRVPESPGARLKREGLTAHPVVWVPGIVTGGLELWEGKPCSQGLFRKRLWGGSFTKIFKRHLCWLEHLSLDNETRLDLPGIRVRAVPELIAADYFAPGAQENLPVLNLKFLFSYFSSPVCASDLYEKVLAKQSFSSSDSAKFEEHVIPQAIWTNRREVGIKGNCNSQSIILTKVGL